MNINKFKILSSIILIINLNYIVIGKNSFDISNFKKSEVDVTVVGILNYAHGIGRIGVGFIDVLKDKLKVNCIPKTFNVNDIDKNILNVIKYSKSEPGDISILFYPLFGYWVKQVPNSLIKLAYSVFESTQIPEDWVCSLNNKFDAVITACPFLVNVYKNSGVSIPIFLMSHGIYIDEFLSSPIKSKKNNPFVFGCSATFLDKKNIYKLVVAFANKFGNNKNFRLKLHSSFSLTSERLKIIDYINSNNLKNIEIIEKILSKDEYLEFMRSLDCYILISKGEGFSVTPRESIALGIPTIVSNNTAHKELCQTPYFIPVKADIIVPANYLWPFRRYIGNQFDCAIKDVEDTLEYVYNNYELCLDKAKGGREWVKQYTYQALEKKYLNLVKPQNIILGDDNIVTDDYLMTNSKKLYDKYLLIKKFRLKEDSDYEIKY